MLPRSRGRKQRLGKLPWEECKLSPKETVVRLLAATLPWKILHAHVRNLKDIMKSPSAAATLCKR